MSDVSFVAYVGEPDIHDGSIISVEHNDNTTARVRVRGASGRIYVVTFKGVAALRANSAEGIKLYALSELRSEPPLRRFNFVNWDDDDEASLEIDAEEFSIIAEPSAA